MVIVTHQKNILHLEPVDHSYGAENSKLHTKMAVLSLCFTDLFLPFPSLPSSPLSLIINSDILQ